MPWLLLIFDMSVKPSFSDGSTIVGALLAGAALSALLVLPAGRTVVETPAAAGDRAA